MRFAAATCLLLTLACAVTLIAARAWKPGTWAARGEGGSYVIETRTDLITGEATPSTGTLTATAGTSVQFAVEGQALYVLDAERAEHALRLVSSAAKYSKGYSALGGGHYIKAVAPGGTQVTLEDNSRWDIDPSRHFAVAGWQPDELISLRRAEAYPGFSFEIDNTSQDDGALANYRVR